MPAAFLALNFWQLRSIGGRSMARFNVIGVPRHKFVFPRLRRAGFAFANAINRVNASLTEKSEDAGSVRTSFKCEHAVCG